MNESKSAYYLGNSKLKRGGLFFIEAVGLKLKKIKSRLIIYKSDTVAYT
tara:strand:- start:8 stop:154 length:147 start_codon:yes stop_codon:yes gene_type:complete